MFPGYQPVSDEREGDDRNSARTDRDRGGDPEALRKGRTR